MTTGDSRGLTSRSVRAGLWSAGYVVALCALYAAAVLSPEGQGLDALSLGAFAWLGPVAEVLAALRTPLAVASGVAAAVVVVLGLLRRRFAAAIPAGLAVLVVGIVNDVLRDVVFTRPFHGFDNGYVHNTFPSGHVAVALTSCAAIIALIPPARVTRTIVFALGAVPVLVALGSVSGFAHRSADVVGGALLAGAIVVWIPSASSLRGPRTAFGRILAAVGAVVMLGVWVAAASGWMDVAHSADVVFPILIAAASALVSGIVFSTVVPDRSVRSPSRV